MSFLTAGAPEALRGPPMASPKSAFYYRSRGSKIHLGHVGLKPRERNDE
jgi:hypothetical protein